MSVARALAIAARGVRYADYEKAVEALRDHGPATTRGVARRLKWAQSKAAAAIHRGRVHGLIRPLESNAYFALGVGRFYEAKPVPGWPTPAIDTVRP